MSKKIVNSLEMYDLDHDPAAGLTISSETIESKPRELKPMAWWWIYTIFSHGCPPPSAKSKRFLFTKAVLIEKCIRWIIRKPVKRSVPKFEVSQDMVIEHGLDVEKELTSLILKELINEKKRNKRG